MGKFAEARRIFETLPGDATLQQAVAHLERSGVDRSAMRRWAIAISHEFGIASYVDPIDVHVMTPALRAANDFPASPNGDVVQ